MVEKVTCFIINTRGQVALFRHPFAGVQFPAGTVELGETHEDGALREAWEESGLEELKLESLVAVEDEVLTEDRYVICEPTSVYARPDVTSFDWVHMRRGTHVKKCREEGGWAQILYTQMNDSTNPEYVTYQIMGWVPMSTIANVQKRYFYVLKYHGPIQDKWTVQTDNHTFTLGWYNREEVPQVCVKQHPWIRHIPCGVVDSIDQKL